MEKPIYIHYGSDVFDPKITLEAKYAKRFWDTGCYIKPGGLWASPENAYISWKEWCESEDFHTDRLDKSFRFHLKDGARVLDIFKLLDLRGYTVHGATPFGHNLYLDLDMIYRDYDAMEVHHEDNYWELHGSTIFNAWDVDSICVWNPDVVEVIKEEG